MRVPVSGWWLLAVLLLGQCWLDPTLAAAPLAATCSPRPPVTVAVVPAGVGTLQVTIGAASAAGVTLQQVVFNAPTNALIDVPGRPPGSAQPAPMDVAGQSSATFSFRPATAGQAVTVPLTVVDSCGSWPTFVGGGPTAFAAPPGLTPSPTTVPTLAPGVTPSATTVPTLAPGVTPSATTAAAASPTTPPSATPTPTATAKSLPIVTTDLNASQQVLGGQTIGVYWSGLSNIGAKDQIGLYRTTDASPYNNRLDKPVFIAGQASGTTNVVIANESLLAGTQSDIFHFVLYHVDASSSTPVYVTQSQSFTVVMNTVAMGEAKAPAGGPRAGPKAAGGAGAKGQGSSSGAPIAAPVAAATPVAGNDSFSGAAVVGSLPASFTESTTGATPEAGEPTTCSGAPLGKTVWFRVAPGAGTVTVDTYGSTFDTVLAVYTGSAVNALTLLTCDDDSAGTRPSRVSFATGPATTYHVQVGGYAGAAGNLVVHFGRAAPANDNFGAASAIAALPAQVAAITDSATSEPGEPTFVSCITAQAGIGQTAWYRLTPGAGTVTIDTLGSSFDTVLAVYTGSAVNALTLLTCDDDSAGTRQSRVSFPALGGTTYYVQAGGFARPNPSGGGTLGFTDAGNLTVSFKITAAPLNDAFAQAIPLSLPSSANAVTALATTEAGEPTASLACTNTPGTGKTVWYTLSPVAGTVVTLDTIGSNFDTVLAVYTGSAVNALTLVLCNDDSGGIRVSQLSFTATGATYRIQVGGYTDATTPSQSGNLVLNVASTPNDALASAYEVAGMSTGTPAQFQQITTSASTETGEPAANFCDGFTRPTGKTIWYRFTPQVPATVAIDTIGSSFDTVLAVYTSANGTIGGLALPPVACNDDDSGQQSRVVFAATAFTTYYVQAGGYGEGAAIASGNLMANFTLLAPANDDRTNAIEVTTFPAVYSLATLGATVEAGEPTMFTCGGVPANLGRTVWFKLTNSADAPVTITTRFSSYDTVLATYRLDSGVLTLLECSDDAAGTLQSALTLDMAANAQYFVQVSGPIFFYGADFGNLYVSFSSNPPPNNNFAQALAVPGAGGQRRVFTADASTEAGEPTANVCDGFTRPTGKTVWYRYVPGARPVTVNTFGSNFDTVLAVYTGNAVNGLSLVGCNDDAAGGNTSQFSFAATAGTTYYVQVGGHSGGAGTAIVNFN